MTPSDISSIPPLDSNGQMKRAATLLDRFRKQLDDKDDQLDVEWKRWVAGSLLKGLPEEAKP